MSAAPSVVLVLLVEDDGNLNGLLEEGLGEDGIAVVLARNGDEGIRELESGAARFKGLVTDIRLGEGPSGWDIAHRARELVPHMPVVYMSGDSAADWPAHGVPESIMLQKPFLIAQLVTALVTLLNKTTSALPASPAPSSE